MKVRAIADGFFDNHLVKTGDVFIINPRKVPAYVPKLDDAGKPVVVNGKPAFTTKLLFKDGVQQFDTLSENQQFSGEWMELYVEPKPAPAPAPLKIQGQGNMAPMPPTPPVTHPVTPAAPPVPPAAPPAEKKV